MTIDGQATSIEDKESMLQCFKRNAKKAANYTVNLAKETVEYAIANPEDVMLLIATIALVDMESSLDSIEEATEVSATVDVLNYSDNLGA